MVQCVSRRARQPMDLGEGWTNPDWRPCATFLQVRAVMFYGPTEVVPQQNQNSANKEHFWAESQRRKREGEPPALSFSPITHCSDCLTA